MITRSATLLLLLLLLRLVDPTTSSTAAASSGGMIIISSGRSSLESTSHANLLVPDLATPRSVAQLYYFFGCYCCCWCRSLHDNAITLATRPAAKLHDIFKSKLQQQKSSTKTATHCNRERERERERILKQLSNSQAPSSALKSHHLLSKAIISSEENHIMSSGGARSWGPVPVGGISFFQVFLLLFIFFSGIDSRKRENERKKGERKVVRIPEIDSSTPKKEPNQKKKKKKNQVIKIP